MTIQQLIDELNSIPKEYRNKPMNIQILSEDTDIVLPNCQIDLNIEGDTDDCLTITLPDNCYISE